LLKEYLANKSKILVQKLPEDASIYPSQKLFNITKNLEKPALIVTNNMPRRQNKQHNTIVIPPDAA